MPPTWAQRVKLAANLEVPPAPTRATSAVAPSGSTTSAPAGVSKANASDNWRSSGSSSRPVASTGGWVRKEKVGEGAAVEPLSAPVASKAEEDPKATTAEAGPSSPANWGDANPNDQTLPSPAFSSVPLPQSESPAVGPSNPSTSSSEPAPPPSSDSTPATSIIAPSDSDTPAPPVAPKTLPSKPVVNVWEVRKAQIAAANAAKPAPPPSSSEKPPLVSTPSSSSATSKAAPAQAKKSKKGKAAKVEGKVDYIAARPNGASPTSTSTSTSRLAQASPPSPPATQLLLKLANGIASGSHTTPSADQHPLPLKPVQSALQALDTVSKAVKASPTSVPTTSSGSVSSGNSATPKASTSLPLPSPPASLPASTASAPAFQPSAIPNGVREFAPTAVPSGPPHGHGHGHMNGGAPRGGAAPSRGRGGLAGRGNASGVNGGRGAFRGMAGGGGAPFGPVRPHVNGNGNGGAGQMFGPGPEMFMGMQQQPLYPGGFQNGPQLMGDPYAMEPTRYWLLGQIEYYFSVDNLCRDIFLRSKMDDEGWIDVSVIASFNRIKTLSADYAFVRDTMAFTPLLEVFNGAVRLRHSWAEWVLPTAAKSTVLAQATPESPKSRQPSAATSQDHSSDDDEEGTAATTVSASSQAGEEEPKSTVSSTTPESSSAEPTATESSTEIAA